MQTPDAQSPARHFSFSALQSEMRSKLTDEQLEVVDTIERGDNVCCLAVAGSGKTTTSLTAAVAFVDRNPDKEVCILTYNARLKEETRVKVSNMPRSHGSRITVDSYHASATRYFNTGNRDISAVVTDALSLSSPTTPIPNYGLIVVDEAQDLTAEFYKYICHFLRTMLKQPVAMTGRIIGASGRRSGENSTSLNEELNLDSARSPPQMLILGDPFQRIYGKLKGATIQYMYRNDESFVKEGLVKQSTFVNLRLSICFRITHEMAEWICEKLNPNNLERRYPKWWNENKNGERVESWWGNGIRADPNRPRVPDSMVFIESGYRNAASMFKIKETVTQAMQEYGNKNFTVISRQVRGLKENHPTTLILNRVSEKDWYVDDKDATEDETLNVLLKNKFLVSSIHKYKGIERDAIVVLSLDRFSELDAATMEDPLELFNVFYVACTRARKKLIVVQWGEPYVTVQPSLATPAEGRDIARALEVTNLLTFAGYDPVLSVRGPQCAVNSMLWLQCPPCPKLKNIVPGRTVDTFEDVSAIVGMAMELRFDQKADGCVELPAIVDHFGEPMELSKAKKAYAADFIDRYMQVLEEGKTNAASWSWIELCEAATLLFVAKNKQMHVFRQITNFASWVNEDALELIFCQYVSMLFECLLCRNAPFGASLTSPQWMREELAKRSLTTTQQCANNRHNSVYPQNKAGGLLSEDSNSFSQASPIGGASDSYPSVTLPACEKCEDIAFEAKFKLLVGANRIRREQIKKADGRVEGSSNDEKSVSTMHAQSVVRLPFTSPWFKLLGIGIQGMFDLLHYELEYMPSAQTSPSTSASPPSPPVPTAGPAKQQAFTRRVRIATIVELKMTNRERPEHTIQLALYGALFLLTNMGYSAGDPLVTLAARRLERDAARAAKAVAAKANEIVTIIEDDSANDDSVARTPKADDVAADEIDPIAVYDDIDDETAHHTILHKNLTAKTQFGALRLLLVYPQLGIARRVILQVSPFEYIYRMARRKSNLPFNEELYQQEVAIQKQTDADSAARGAGTLTADGSLIPVAQTNSNVDKTVDVSPASLSLLSRDELVAMLVRQQAEIASLTSLNAKLSAEVEEVRANAASQTRAQHNGGAVTTTSLEARSVSGGELDSSGGAEADESNGVVSLGNDSPMDTSTPPTGEVTPYSPTALCLSNQSSSHADHTSEHHANDKRARFNIFGSPRSLKVGIKRERDEAVGESCAARGESEENDSFNCCTSITQNLGDGTRADDPIELD